MDLEMRQVVRSIYLCKSTVWEILCNESFDTSEVKFQGSELERTIISPLKITVERKKLLGAAPPKWVL